jgi:hypothetical protein
MTRGHEQSHQSSRRSTDSPQGGERGKRSMEDREKGEHELSKEQDERSEWWTRRESGGVGWS